MIKAASEGATKGFLDWTEEKLSDLARGFESRDLLFIEDRQTIDLVKEQRKKPEWELAKKYIRDRDLRIQIQMGLALRRLESNPPKLKELRDKIYKKYQSPGLHIAEIVQTGIFVKYIGLLLGQTLDETELVEKLNALLKENEKYVVFIKTQDDAYRKTQEIVARLRANLPPALVVFSSGTAIDVSLEIVKSALTQIEGYHQEIQVDKDNSEPERVKLYNFLLRTELRQNSI